MFLFFLSHAAIAESPAIDEKTAIQSPAPSPATSLTPEESSTSEPGWVEEGDRGGSKDRQMKDNFFRRIVTTLFSLIVVSIIAFLVLRLIYAKQGLLPGLTQRERMIKIVERQALTPQKSLCLVEVAGKYLLLGVSENRIDYLMEIEGDRMRNEIPQENVSPADYKEYLEKYSFPKPVMFLFSKLIEGKKK